MIVVRLSLLMYSSGKSVVLDIKKSVVDSFGFIAGCTADKMQLLCTQEQTLLQELFSWLCVCVGGPVLMSRPLVLSQLCCTQQTSCFHL